MGPLIRVSKILAGGEGETKVDRNPGRYPANQEAPVGPQEAGVDKACKGETNRRRSGDGGDLVCDKQLPNSLAPLIRGDLLATQ